MSNNNLAVALDNEFNSNGDLTHAKFKESNECSPSGQQENRRLSGVNLMDALKMKMQQSKDELEECKKEVSTIDSKIEEEVRERESIEDEVMSLQRKLILVERELVKADDRLEIAKQKLDSATESAREVHEITVSLKANADHGCDKLAELQERVSTANCEAEEADRKYEESSRKLILLEADLERAKERAEIGESNIAELEEELKVIANSLKSLECCNTEPDTSYEEKIQELNKKCEEAESRAEMAERAVLRLQTDMHRMENRIDNERIRNKKLEGDMASMYDEIEASISM